METQPRSTRGILIPVLIVGVIAVVALVAVAMMGGEATSPSSQTPDRVQGAAARPQVAPAPPEQSAAEPTIDGANKGDDEWLADHIQEQGLFRGPKKRMIAETHDASEHRAKLNPDDDATAAPAK